MPGVVASRYQPRPKRNGRSWSGSHGRPFLMPLCGWSGLAWGSLAPGAKSARCADAGI